VYKGNTSKIGDPYYEWELTFVKTVWKSYCQKRGVHSKETVNMVMSVTRPEVESIRILMSSGESAFHCAFVFNNS